MEEHLELFREFTDAAIALRILLSAALGGVIGLERERIGRAAGLRTHILVCLGSTMAAVVGLYVSCRLNFSNDPLRVGAQVVSGIGFLGVGTILTRNNARVTGLTTAAGLWTTAAIGLAVGVGFYLAALMATVVAVLTMALLNLVERRMKCNCRKSTLYVELIGAEHVKETVALLSELSTAIQVTAPRTSLENHVGIEMHVLSSVLTDKDCFFEGLRRQEYVLILTVQTHA